VFELQNDVDPSKLRRLHLAVAIVHDATGQLPDVVVLTRSRRVARWARRMEPLKGSLGTQLVLTPIVLYIGDAEAERLLATGHPLSIRHISRERDSASTCAANVMRSRPRPTTVAPGGPPDDLPV